MNFYDEWLAFADRDDPQRKNPRRVIHYDELEWVETPQDAKIALLVSPQTGFRTWGSETMCAEIPVGWHTGRHKHGEEAIYIVEGQGKSIIDGILYEWQTDSTLLIPFGSVHQHFNTGDVPVRYVSAMAVSLEQFVGIHRTVQFEKAGSTTGIPQAEQSPNGFGPDGKRVAIDIAETSLKATTNHLEYRSIMSIPEPENGFDVREHEISGILTDAPHTHGGKHAHMEAHIHILAGEGYSIIDEERVPWRRGSTLHIIGPQTPHQHFNDSDVQSRMLRTAPGLRYFIYGFASREYPAVKLETVRPDPVTDAVSG